MGLRALGYYGAAKLLLLPVEAKEDLRGAALANPELTLLCGAGLTRRLLAALFTWKGLALL